MSNRFNFDFNSNFDGTDGAGLYDPPALPRASLRAPANPAWRRTWAPLVIQLALL